MTGQSHRLRGLFEGNLLALGIQANLKRNPTGHEDTYADDQTNRLFCLWLAGRQQGVVDQAFKQGEITL